METAKILGVPRRRALELIKLVDSLHAASSNNGAAKHGTKTNLEKRKVTKRKKRVKSPKASR
jgi:hypothetical protein